MSEFLDFALRNWYLFAMLVVFIGWFLLADTMQRSKGIIAIGPQKAIRLMNDDAVQVYDVRPQKDYQNGFIKGAKHLDSANLKNYVTEIDKSKKSPLIVCARGATSSGIAAKLKKAGVKSDVYALAGGMVKWQEEKLPISKK